MIRCVWEHNGGDSLLYASDYAGAFTRGPSRDAAMKKMPDEVRSYLEWMGGAIPAALEPVIVQEKASEVNVADADSDVIFDTERDELNLDEYERLRALALMSARDLLALYEAVPDKDLSCLPPRNTFYGPVPRTAREMYEHTKNVNEYYFGEIGLTADNGGTILECRERGFASLERQSALMKNTVHVGSYDEEWSLRKVLRRFIWHDRIHAKAMYRMAVRTFGQDSVPNVFRFRL